MSQVHLQPFKDSHRQENEVRVICSTKLITACIVCDGWTGRMRTPVKVRKVASREELPFLKMTGHQDPVVFSS